LLQEAAREVFAERGYSATTREIASRAGVSHDLIFRYFDSKEKLFFDAVVSPLLDAVGSLHQRWLDDPVLTTMSHDRLADRFVRGFYAFMSTNQLIAHAMVQLFVSPSADGELQRLRQRITETLAPIIAPFDAYLAAQNLRRSEPALQLRLVLLLVGGTATFLPKTYATDKAVPSTEVIVEQLSRFISHGLRDAPPPA
jgi:AcrR family transcriptional regulator